MMLRHPAVLKRAQREIDEVIGTDRLPTFNDRDDLPYTSCVLKEVYRICPAVPLGLPHRAMHAETYKGDVIPEGSMVFANLWQMMRDEQYFPEPERFNPDRFMRAMGQRKSGRQGASASASTSAAVDAADVPEDGPGGAADDPFKIVWGFGRRICPARYFADAGLWLTLANVLAVFDVLPPVDGPVTVTGEEKIPEEEFTTGMTSRPKPFECRIVPRSENHALLVRNAALLSS